MDETVHFRILENCEDSTNNIYNDFKSEYISNNGTVQDLSVKYDVSISKAYKLINQIFEETGFRRRKTNKKVYSPKYYCKPAYSNNWRVFKHMNNSTIYFGSYSSEDKAKYVVNELKKCNWDKSELERIKSEVGI